MSPIRDRDWYGVPHDILNLTAVIMNRWLTDLGDRNTPDKRDEIYTFLVGLMTRWEKHRQNEIDYLHELIMELKRTLVNQPFVAPKTLTKEGSD